MPDVRIACVAAPASNAFIVEILEAVAAEVTALGVEASVHKGTVADVYDEDTAFLIIPHEYYWFNPRPSAEHLKRTITLDVEHPGTHGFEVTSRVAQVVGAVFEISSDSVQELARRGLRADLFTIGYSERWDMWGGGNNERSVDLTYMAAADRERVQILARLAPDLADINANLLIPPYENRIKQRPDFLMGETKWRFLADAKVLLNLHRESKTALELIRTVEAMCNGCVVLTEPSTGLGIIEPGTHILVAPRESIGLEAHRVLSDTDGLRATRDAAYEFCKRELSMRSSAERLIAVAEEVVRNAKRTGAHQIQMPDWPEVKAPYVPELAEWVPQPYPLPPAAVTVAAPVEQALRELVEHRREHMELNDIYVGTPSDAEVDVIIVSHKGSGPIGPTLSSLASQSVAANIHVAGLGIPRQADAGPLASYLTCSAETSVGAARNELIERSSAPYLLVLEAGDQLLGGSLSVLLERLQNTASADLVYTMAAYGQETLVNLFHPELIRLQKDAYLTRGYLVRRDSLARLGGFAEDPLLDGYTDHEFWLRAARNPDAIVHLHRIGLRLWPTDRSKMMPANPAEVHEVLSLRAEEALTEERARRPETAPKKMPTLDADTLPKVSALMGAYNYGRYIVQAIDSAMQQEYPEQLLELVIVDDGSTDDTAELVVACMERYPGRIKFIQQTNAGATAATNRARREATGDLIALLDADDVWVPEKTRLQVELMQRRPELGLVFSRMRVVDGAGATLYRNYGHQEPIPENGFARVLWENVAVQSSLIIKAELFEQMPAEAPYADWWLCLAAAQFEKIDYLREELVLYRWHDANITGGATGIKALREAQKGIGFQRWVLRNFDLDEFIERLTPKEMAYVWTGLENQGQKGLSGLKSHFGRLATVSDEDRAQAVRDVAAAELAFTVGDFRQGCALLLRARAGDPFDADIRDRFDTAVRDAEAAETLPDPMAGHRGFAVLTDAEYLLGDDSRLRAYAATMGSIQEAALVIDASRMDADHAAQELGALVERCGLADDDLIMIGIVGALHPSQRARVDRSTHARYADADADDIPTFTPDSLGALRDFYSDRAGAQKVNS